MTKLPVKSDLRKFTDRASTGVMMCSLSTLVSYPA